MCVNHRRHVTAVKLPLFTLVLPPCFAL